jgi:hypothetical protein
MNGKLARDAATIASGATAVCHDWTCTMSHGLIDTQRYTAGAT